MRVTPRGSRWSLSLAGSRVEGGKLRLDNLDAGTKESIARASDLAGAATATLTFDYDGFGEGGLDSVAFEISNDGGSSWTLLERVDVIGNVAGSKSYTLAHEIIKPNDEVAIDGRATSVIMDLNQRKIVPVPSCMAVHLPRRG